MTTADRLLMLLREGLVDGRIATYAGLRGKHLPQYVAKLNRRPGCCVVNVALQAWGHRGRAGLYKLVADPDAPGVCVCAMPACRNPVTNYGDGLCSHCELAIANRPEPNHWALMQEELDIIR